jgi:hypothetical protein
MEHLLTLIHRWNSRTSITITAGAAPIWKTLEMTDIPGAAYKATCRVASTKYYHAFRASDNRRYCSCCERQSVS